MSKFLPFLCLVVSSMFACSNGEDSPKGDEGGQHAAHAEDGPHGGHLLELGAHLAHLELLHDMKAGTLTIHVLGSDAKSAKNLFKAPQAKLMTDAGPTAIDAEPRAGVEIEGGVSEWIVTGEALKRKDVRGRISVELDGRTYNPEIVVH